MLNYVREVDEDGGGGEEQNQEPWLSADIVAAHYPKRANKYRSGFFVPKFPSNMDSPNLARHNQRALSDASASVINRPLQSRSQSSGRHQFAPANLPRRYQPRGPEKQRRRQQPPITSKHNSPPSSQSVAPNNESSRCSSRPLQLEANPLPDPTPRARSRRRRARRKSKVGSVAGLELDNDDDGFIDDVLSINNDLDLDDHGGHLINDKLTQSMCDLFLADCKSSSNEEDGLDFGEDSAIGEGSLRSPDYKDLLSDSITSALGNLQNQNAYLTFAYDID